LNEWHSPPFEPTVRDGKLYARGAVDDKGQVYCLFKAYEAARDANRNPPLNVHWILEGEEECGGEAIDDLLKAQPERTAVDAVLVCDAGYYAPGIPAVYTALRGMCYAEISVRTALSDLHSGLYGGAVPNALETLVRLLSQLKDDSGKINVPRLYKSVIPPTKAELKAWKSLPFKKKQFMEEETTTKTLTGLKEYSVFERLWALPTFDIHGIMGGFTGEGAKTVIPAQATAKVSLRLVPGLEYEKVLKQLDTAVQRLAPSWAEVSVRAIHGADPVQIDVSTPAFAVLDQAFEEVVGRKTVAVRSGGSIPVVSRLGMRGAPVLLTGVGLPDDGLHAPNEKIDLDQVWDGINVFGRFFELLAERGAA
jgi:acetylornithine deacetylase/succinyl-diaminopimelate desuccinylase-like protein